ncbi:MAG TPA: hypothetical protein VJN94_10895 [Candidatus Binataceae bacterium]|nr:hypothetical protein [Candidatus Binataceae bacterium]
MKIELFRSHIEIYPEGAADLAYIEDTLGMRRAGNRILLIRLDHGPGPTPLIRLVAGRKSRSIAQLPTPDPDRE